jgi:hypothetical protein
MVGGDGGDEVTLAGWWVVMAGMKLVGAMVVVMVGGFSR